MSASLFWFLLGIAFFAGELTTPAFLLFFFGIGAWTAAGLAFFVAGLHLQILVFAASSLISLAFLRHFLRGILSGGTRKADTKTRHPLSGRRGVVTKALRPGESGEISIEGSFWRATAKTGIPVGETVIVLDSPLLDDAMTLYVGSASADATNFAAGQDELK
ncbi:MAG: NfeD family protein [Desulfovibrio sp.]|jgi:membrane protein implicated in regulation of membrane protease activity|nr:NfeD family protein [Desulfovibrio sp.]